MHIGPFEILVLPRAAMDWEEFVKNTPTCSIALDGAVRGGPRIDTVTRHINFDHHDGVVRDATMSTAMQVYVKIKGGLFDLFRINDEPAAHIYINDTDQDVAFAVWLLLKHELFEGTRTIPSINRLLYLDSMWDITGGAFPMNLTDKLVRQHGWVFEPYTDLRKSGQLAIASKEMLESNLQASLARLDKFMMGEAGEKKLDTRHEILFDSPKFKIINEIGGNDARYWLFSLGMNAYISRIATRPDGRFVYTIGRRSDCIPFPVTELYDVFNEAEGLIRINGWNGSDIIGGSSREHGSGLNAEQLRDLTIACLKQKG